MAVCSTCGFDNRAGTRSCELCGAPLSALPKPLAGTSPVELPRVPSGIRQAPPELRRPPEDTDQGASTQRPPPPNAHGTTETSTTRSLYDYADQTSPRVRAPASNAAPRPTSVKTEGPPPKRSRHRSGPDSAVGELATQAAVSGIERPAGEALIGRLKLTVEQGLIIGEQYLLTEQQMIIGRADHKSRMYPDIDLSGQDNEYVHRQHARLQFHDLGTRLSVEHLGGANPTLVNNRPAEDGEMVELLPGDRLRVGRVVMRVSKA